MKRGMLFGGIIVAAMLAFELFNYTTTDFALADLLGDLRFLGLRWAMILAVAFCAMDFAGIARLFTAERGRGERVEVWYLLGAWFLAATMNAMLTWWGVSLALLRHPSLGNEILSRDTLLAGVPVFVAILVWLIRILLIGMMSMMGERLFSQVGDAMLGGRRESQRLPVPATATSAPRPTGQMAGPLPQAIRPATLAPAAHLPRTQVPGSAGVATRPARVIGGGSAPDDDSEPRRPPASEPAFARPVRPAPKPVPSGAMHDANGSSRPNGDHF